MASQLNPFRKQESAKPLHARWGDVSISVPTEGSWSQYNNPTRRHKRANYGPGYVPDCKPEPIDRHPRHCHSHKHHRPPPSRTSSTTSEESTSSNDSSSSHRSSSLITTLNPCRLSMRLSPRPKTPSDHHHQKREDLIATSHTEFAYKPIKVDYPAEVAGTKTSQGQCQVKRTNSNAGSTRFRYIPASAKYREELDEIPERSRIRDPGSMGRRKDRRESRHGERDSRRDGYTTSEQSGKRSLGGTSKISQPGGKCLTTALVPDPDELYE